MEYINKKTILCAFLCSTSFVFAGSNSGNQAVTGIIQPIVQALFGGNNDNSNNNPTQNGQLLNLASQQQGQGATASGGSAAGNAASNASGGAVAGNTAGGANASGSAALPGGIPALPAGIPGLTAALNGSTSAGNQNSEGRVVNNITYNINNSSLALPEGYQQAKGADGKPVPPTTKVDETGAQVKVIEAVAADGKKVELQQKQDENGKPVVVELKTNEKTGQTETKVIPEEQVKKGSTITLPALPGLNSGNMLGMSSSALSAVKSNIPQMTREQLFQVVGNPYTKENLAIYEQIKSLAVQDPEDKEALAALDEFVPPAKAQAIRIAVLEKYIDAILDNQVVVQQQVQAQQIAQQQAIQAQQQAEMIRKQSMQQDIERLIAENAALVEKLKASGAPMEVIAGVYNDARREVGAPPSTLMGGSQLMTPMTGMGAQSDLSLNSNPMGNLLGAGGSQNNLNLQPAQGLLAQNTVQNLAQPNLAVTQSSAQNPTAGVAAQAPAVSASANQAGGLPSLPSMPQMLTFGEKPTSGAAAPAPAVSASANQAGGLPSLPSMPQMPTFGAKPTAATPAPAAPSSTKQSGGLPSLPSMPQMPSFGG